MPTSPNASAALEAGDRVHGRGQHRDDDRSEQEHSLVGDRLERERGVQAARVVLEAVRPAGTRARVAPGVPGDQVLEVGGELVGAGDRAVDVRVAEHLAAYRHALLVPSAVVHRSSSRPGSGAQVASRSRRPPARAARRWPGAPRRRPPRSRAPGYAVGDLARRARPGSPGRPAPATTSVGAVIAGQVGPQVHRGDRLAAGGVPVRRRRGQHRPVSLYDRRRAVGQGRGEPAGHAPVGDRRRSAGADRGGPVPPALRPAEPGRRAEQRQPVDPLGRVRGQPHADHAAEGQPGVRGPGAARGRPAGRSTSPPSWSIVYGPAGTRESPWPEVVVPDHPEPLGERRQLRFPHRPRRCRASCRAAAPARRPGRRRGHAAGRSSLALRLRTPPGPGRQNTAGAEPS